ncbi:aminodeoxyfutalosine deaminase [Mumia flava]|uniref:Aminodeoxyfutalosine deaminase n=1 Tax=Mumia flava TaxID=1348852 RepID=A0A0B2B3N5_9ACTN|nr:adenosine deaminase [Mumia flava]PJJ53472.1 aminodeoxyfutalosine deaminase [Mumia flava]
MTSPAPVSPAAAFVHALPKAEIHVHLLGAASVETVLGLARRHPEVGVPTDEAALRDFYEFRDFAHFIEVYIRTNQLVTTPDDVADLVAGVAEDMAAQTVRYAELTVTPDSQLLMGIAPEALAEALTEGRRRARATGVELAWVFDIPGELGLVSGERTIDWVERHAPEGTVGFGLGGPEIGVERPQFADVFARARALGLASVPHAGETTGPQTVRDALEHLGAVRVGHGIRAVDDPALVAELVERRIPLEVAPTSNLRTRAVDSLDHHPFLALRDAGVIVTLNSDDPGMFDTTLEREYLLAHDRWGLTLAELADVARAAVDASFASAEVRRAVHTEIDQVVADQLLTS